jgi:hypothetical protein
MRLLTPVGWCEWATLSMGILLLVVLHGLWLGSYFASQGVFHEVQLECGAEVGTKTGFSERGSGERGREECS